MTFADAISARILELLEKNEIKVTKLATNAGINESTIRSLLNKSTNCPNTLTLHYICIGFGIHISEFFQFELFDENNLIDD